MVMSAPTESRQVGVGARSVQLIESGTGTTVVYLGAELSPDPLPAAMRAMTGRFRVVAPIHPGFAEGDTPTWMSSCIDLAYHYSGVVDEISGGEQILLVGASLGGWIAAELASLRPAGLTGLALLAPLGLRKPGDTDVDLFYDEPAGVLDAYAPSVPATTRLASVDDHMRYQRELGVVSRVGWDPYLADPALAERLSRVAVPTLLVWGDRDRITGSSAAELFRAALRQPEVELVRSDAHDLATEEPGAVSKAMTSFFHTCMQERDDA
jgi:pimeloyl-ACP methyl ester carboxylesterase